jgi:hypothetical protein
MLVAGEKRKDYHWDPAWSIPFFLTGLGFGCVGLASVYRTCQPAPYWPRILPLTGLDRAATIPIEHYQKETTVDQNVWKELC